MLNLNLKKNLRLLDAINIFMSNTIILIPSRMSAERLPGKPLLEVNGLPIICHVVKKAQETQIGEVVVATEDEEILNTVKKNQW